MLRSLLTIAAVLVATTVFATGGPDYLPDGSHPRIWLNSTELTRLNAKQSASDPAWTALEAWCDLHLSDAGYTNRAGDLANWDGNNTTNGYRFSGWSQHLMNYALAYQVLKDDNPTKALTYANRVRTLLLDGVAVSLRAGEENNGLWAIRAYDLHDGTNNSGEATALGISAASSKNGYATRNASSVPIAYDWIYESGVLTTEDKATLSSMMLRWFDWIRGVRSTYNNGVLKSGVRYHEDKAGDCTGTNVCTSVATTATVGMDYLKVGANFNSGHMVLMAMVPLAVYGDNPDAAAYLGSFKDILSTSVYPALSSNLKQSGGDSPEGWNYGGAYTRMVQALYGYYTATADPSVPNLSWIGDTNLAMLHRTAGDGKSIPYWGYWTGVPYGVNRKQFVMTFGGVEQRLHPDSAASKLSRYLLVNGVFTDTYNQWEGLLWPMPEIAQISPSTQPLTYIAAGNGLFSTRTSWDTDAVHITARLEGKSIFDHEGYDEGNISVIRGGDRLLDHANAVGDAPGAVSFSTVVFNGANHQQRNPDQATPAIKRSEDAVGYSYVRGEISNAWKRQYNTDRALKFDRSVLFIRPGFVVVSDITRSNGAYDSTHRKQWYTQYTASPTVSGNTISATTGSSKVYVQSLYPSGGSYTTTNPVTGSWRAIFTPPSYTERQSWLHVIEATDSAAPQTQTTLIDGTGGRGALIGGNTVAMFTKDADGADMAALLYSVNTTAPSTHYIADLTPGASYTVAVDGGPATTYTASTAGVVTFTSAATSGHTYSVVMDGTVPAVNGVCGTASGQTFSAAPTANLCGDGSAPLVSLSGSTYSWACLGSNGGTSAPCSATYAAAEPIPTTSTSLYFPRVASTSTFTPKTARYWKDGAWHYGLYRVAKDGKW